MVFEASKKHHLIVNYVIRFEAFSKRHARGIMQKTKEI